MRVPTKFSTSALDRRAAQYYRKFKFSDLLPGTAAWPCGPGSGYGYVRARIGQSIFKIYYLR
eukprot:SAG31_NODE_3135_length_4636_cov_7.918448_3_plen_62_part_00